MEEVIVPFNINNFLITKKDIKMLFAKYNLNIDVNDISYYRTALTHKSYIVSEYTNYNCSILKQIKESMDKSVIDLMPESSERIEFFGDTVIKCVVAKYLYLRYPDESEGFLTKTKTKIENRKSLANFARKLGLDNYLIMSKQNEDAGNRDSDKFLEDAFEAFIGAMFNDFGSENQEEGFKICNNFIIFIVEQKIDITELIINDDNFKDQLMRYYQKMYNGKFPKYEQKEVITSVNAEGITNRRFHMFVRDIDNNIIGEGIARSKKEAEQKAAKAALMHFGISNGF